METSKRRNVKTPKWSDVDLSTLDRRPLPIARSIVGGFLMGLANLVPGVSGGTMILVIGLYDEFITSLADVTRLRFTRRSVVFLGIVGCTAAVAIATLAGTLSRAVTLHESAMFSLFVGMTLGGVPLLCRMIGKPTVSSVAGVAVGLAAMIIVVATNHGLADTEEPDRKTGLPVQAVEAGVAEGTVVPEPAYVRDMAAGALGMSAMVLPGISGAYMLLIMGRYATTFAAIDLAKDYALSFGRQGNPAEFLPIMIPVAIGAIFSLVVLSNLLKWLLRRYAQGTLGLLLGIVFGSVVGIWPFHQAHEAGDYALGTALAVVGFFATLLLGRTRAWPGSSAAKHEETAGTSKIDSPPPAGS